MKSLVFLLAILISHPAIAQCPGGTCPQPPNPYSIPYTIISPDESPADKLHRKLDLPVDRLIHVTPAPESIPETCYTPGDAAEVAVSDRMKICIEATVRVTVSGVCGSGTVVGRDANGAALILTNAHVAGTTKGRTVNVTRWNENGTSELSTARIIASGYARGMSLDFALLLCTTNKFAAQVRAIPLADRQPSGDSVVNYGCPRCEWPSMQCLRMNDVEGNLLRWQPEAIGGRSGSSIVDFSDGSPRVVGLLTWGGGGQGLGQSTPSVLASLRGNTPRAFEALPEGFREVPWKMQSVVDQITQPSADDLCPDCPNGGCDGGVCPPTSPDSPSDSGRIVDRILGNDGGDLDVPEDDSGLLRPNHRGPLAKGVDWFLTVLYVVIALISGIVLGVLGRDFFSGLFAKYVGSKVGG